jgi:tight adherence protein B
MTRRPRRAAFCTALLASLAFTVAETPAAHATDVSITHVDFAADQARLTLTATGLPADATVLPAQLTATVDGHPTPAQVTPVGGLRTAVTRTSVLLVDTSGSMAGSGIAGARTAAAAFLTDVAADVRVGLVSFADATTVLAPPTRDRAVVRAALDRLTAGGNTRLYDALLTAEQQLGSAGERHLLLLSDGTDTASVANQQQVVTRLVADRVQLDVVAFRTQPGTLNALQAMASATSGRLYAAADVDQLAAAFTQVARDYDQQLAVVFSVPAALRGKHAVVAVKLPTTVGTLTASTGVDFPAVTTPPATAAASTAAPSSTPVAASLSAAPSATPAVASASAAASSAPAASASASAAPSSAPAASASASAAVLPAAGGTPPASPTPLTYRGLVTAVVAVGLGLFLLLILAFDVGRTSVGRMRTLRRIARFSLGKTAPLPELPSATGAHGPRAVRESAVARTAVQLASRVVARRDPEQKLRLMLDRAAIPLLPSEWLLVLAGGAAAGTVLMSLLTRNALVGLLVGGTVGGLAPHVVARVRATRRIEAFLAALPDALQVTAGSLATGYSLPQALDTIVRQGQDPIAGEMGRALAQARLGVPIEDALQEVGERMRSKDFEWVVMAIRVNREVGGSLAQVLSTVAGTLREREQLRRHIRGLAAEGVLSAYILVAMPILLGAYLFTFRRAYIRPLYTQPIGLVMLTGAVVLVLLGALWMRSLVKVEV